MDELQNEEVTEETTEAPVDAAPADAAPADEEPATFSREYVQELRREAASYRTKAQPYQDVFDGVEDADRDVLLEMVRQYKTDPKSAISYFDQVANGLRQTFAEELAAAEDDLNRPLTVAEYNRLQEEHRVKSEQEANNARIETEAKGLGYDPTSPEYTYLMTVASKLTGGSLAEAHAKIEAQIEARFQARLDKMKAEAEGSPTAPNAGSGAAPSGERQLKTWRDAELASKARLEAAQIKRG